MYSNGAEPAVLAGVFILAIRELLLYITLENCPFRGAPVDYHFSADVSWNACSEQCSPLMVYYTSSLYIH